MKVIGISGGSGSGKSTISEYLKNTYNAYIIDADKIGHDVIKKGNPAYTAIIQQFGAEYIGEDGEINRKILGAYVFSNAAQLKTLNNITHMYIRQNICDTVKTAIKQNNHPFIIVDGVLVYKWIESLSIDESWIVYADLDVRIKRILVRDEYLTPKEAIRRIYAQPSYSEMMEHCDILIDNNSIFEHAKIEIDKLLKERVLI